jgi:hypothetical protein
MAGVRGSVRRAEVEACLASGGGYLRRDREQGDVRVMWRPRTYRDCTERTLSLLSRNDSFVRWEGQLFRSD